MSTRVYIPVKFPQPVADALHTIAPPAMAGPNRGHRSQKIIEYVIQGLAADGIPVEGGVGYEVQAQMSAQRQSP